jgi:hypothetical protein
MKVLRIFEDGQQLVFQRGKFDDYLVSFYKDGKHINSPTDIQFFDFALSLGDNQAVWKLLYEIAKSITKTTEFSELDIPTLNNTLKEKKFFSAYAAAIIAEERRARTKLGKRVKLLGYYQVLVLGYNPQIAANWSREKKWWEIASECKKYGF